MLDEAIIKELKLKIRAELSPRHVPDQIFQVREIPRTRSGKIAEIAVREVIDGGEVKNLASLANPECLEEYAEITRRLRLYNLMMRLVGSNSVASHIELLSKQYPSWVK